MQTNISEKKIHDQIYYIWTHSWTAILCDLFKFSETVSLKVYLKEKKTYQPAYLKKKCK